MSFRCQITNRLSEPGEKCNKITVQTRPQTYKHKDRETEEEWFSYGTEIVREVNATAQGLRLWESWSEAERESFLKRLS
jgi:hypothetical protein